MNSNEDIEFLLSDPAFRQWVGYPTDALNAYWNSWLRSHPDQEDNFYLAKGIVESILAGELSITEESVAYNIDGILEKTTRKRRRFSYGWYSVAASLVVVAGLAYYNYRSLEKVRNSPVALHQGIRWLQVVNSGKKPEHISLPDGSTVIVLPNSRVSYPEKFSDTLRGVKLRGEAFFEVTKDTQRPFVVSSNHLQTRVLGTSFRVRDSADEAPLVRVKTGTVTVDYSGYSGDRKKLPKSDHQKLVLQAQEEVKFSDLSFTTLPTPSSVNADVPELPIETNNFTYKRTPISEVFEVLKTTYGVTIKYDAEKLQHCTLTARLGDQPLMEKLRMVCLGLNLQFSVDKDGLVNISGGGCK